MSSQKILGFCCIFLLSLNGLALPLNHLPVVQASFFQTLNLNQHLLWQYLLPGELGRVALSANGRTIGLSTGIEPSILTIVDGFTGQVLWNFSPTGLALENRTITCVGLSANGEYIAIGTTGGSIYLFHRSSSDIVQHWQANMPITAITLSELGTFITFAFGSSLYFLSRFEGTPIWGGVLVLPPDTIFNVIGDRMTTYLAVSTSTHELYYIRTGNGEALWDYQFTENTTAISMNIDGSLTLASTPSAAYLFAQTGGLTQIYTIAPRLLAFSVLGNRVAISPNQTVYIYSTSAENPISNGTLMNETPTSLALTANGQLLFLGSSEGELYAINAQDFEILWTLSIGELLAQLLVPDEGDILVTATPTALFGIRISSITGFFIYLIPLVVITIISIILGVITVFIIRPRRTQKFLVTEPSNQNTEQRIYRASFLG